MHRPFIVCIQLVANSYQEVDYHCVSDPFANNTYLGIVEMEKEQQTVELRVDSYTGYYHHYLGLTFDFYGTQTI